jgi:hypothetical protein
MPVSGDADGRLNLKSGPCCSTKEPCTHKLQFKFWLDSSEVGFGGSSGALFLFKGFEMWPEYTDNTWTLNDPIGDTNYTIGPFDPATVAGVWHDFELILVSDGTDIAYTWSVDGVEAAPVTVSGALIGDSYDFTPEPISGTPLYTLLRMGSYFPSGSIAHRSIKDVKVLSNDPVDDDGGGGPFFTVFSFPGADTFFAAPGCPFTSPQLDYGNCGTGISFPGGLILRVDDDTTSGPGSTAIANFPVPEEMICCCDDSVVDNVGNITFEIDVVVSDDCSSGGCFNVSLHLSKTWTRITSGSPGEFQYILQCSDVPGQQGRRMVKPLAGWNSGPYGFGILTFEGFRITNITGPSVTCCPRVNPTPPPDNDVIASDMSSFIDALVSVGDFKEISPGVFDQADCAKMGMKPKILTAGFGCVDSTHSEHNCGDVWDDDLPTDNFDLDALIGTHTWSDSFAHGGRTWSITWALTIAAA